MSFRKKFHYQNLLVTGTVIVSAFVGYITHLVIVRTSNVQIYSDFGLYQSLLSIASVTSIGLQGYTCQYVSQYKMQSIFPSKLLKLSLLIGLPIFFIIVINANYIANYFHIGDTYGLFVTAGIILFLYPLSVFRGILQSQEHYELIALLRFSESIMQLLIIIILLPIIFSSFITVTGSLITIFVFSLLGPYYTRTDILSSAAYVMPRLDVRKMLQHVSLISSLMLVMHGDILYVKHYWVSEAVLYIAISYIGKLFVLIAIALGAALLPRIVRGQNIFILLKSLGFYFIVCSIPIVLLFLVPSDVIDLLYGEGFYSGALLPVPIVIEHFLLGLTYLISIYLVGKNIRGAFFPLLVSLLFVFSSLILVTPVQANEVPLLFLYGVLGGLLISIIFLLFHKNLSVAGVG